ncbi:MAG: hypothetical protein K9M98_11115 [Cephaloticoccus sp.]|nr:hypothetical protein [Cephaloticoccus sp.]MCF7761040.1 hypothetical protein [Cephaloticoccus sp.]
MAWALIYWNIRKGIFILRGRRGYAPCQDSTDDNVAGCMRCNALLDWAEPARFRRVCPLLQSSLMGWRCSVVSSGVRTYWGRAFAWYGGAITSLYLLGTVGLWATLQLTGSSRVTWLEVFWPGSWQRIAEVQAQDFFTQSIMAFRRGQLGEALVYLNSARLRDPTNYEAKLLMAQITMFQGSYHFADDLFHSLLVENPADLERTSITYHDTLLALNRMADLAPFSLEMTSRDPGHTAIWVRSLLLALRSGKVGQDFATKYRDQLAQLAPHALLLIQAEFARNEGDLAQAKAILSNPFAGPLNMVYMQAQIDGLLRLGDASRAEMLLRYYGLALGETETLAQTYLVASAAGDGETARQDFAGLMRGELDVAKVQRLQVLLIQHPNRQLFLKFQDRLLSQPDLLPEVSGAAMWVTGLVCAAPDEGRQWQILGMQQYGDGYPNIDHIDLRSSHLDSKSAVIYIINVLTLPREMIFALLTKVNGSDDIKATEIKRALRR